MEGMKASSQAFLASVTDTKDKYANEAGECPIPASTDYFACTSVEREIICWGY